MRSWHAKLFPQVVGFLAVPGDIIEQEMEIIFITSDRGQISAVMVELGSHNGTAYFSALHPEDRLHQNKTR